MNMRNGLIKKQPNGKIEGVYVLDGGFGSLLEELGYNVNKHELWSGGANLDRPELVSKSHKMFIDAGADIILTNTYHACIQKMQEARDFTLEEAENVVLRAVNLAKEAISMSSRHVYLFGSIGPYATYLRDASEYSGSYISKPGFEERMIVDYYLKQCRPLLASGIRCLVFETIPSLKEVECVGMVLEQLDEDVQAIISVTCQDGSHTRKGDSFRDVVRLANQFEKVIAIGVNCTSPLHITELLQNAKDEMGPNNKKPFVVYPNSGEVYNPETRKFEGDTQIDLIADLIPIWYESGARIFGGCCRVMPEHIKQIADSCHKLSELKSKT